MDKKCLALLKMPDYAEVYPEMVKRIPDKRDIPNEHFYGMIFNYVVPRKRIRDIKLSEYAVVVAEYIAEVIPKESLEEIRRKAARGDADAILNLADCTFFGLKGLVKGIYILIHYFKFIPYSEL